MKSPIRQFLISVYLTKICFNVNSLYIYRGLVVNETPRQLHQEIKSRMEKLKLTLCTILRTDEVRLAENIRDNTKMSEGTTKSLSGLGFTVFLLSFF